MIKFVRLLVLRFSDIDQILFQEAFRFENFWWDIGDVAYLLGLLLGLFSLEISFEPAINFYEWILS